MFIESLFGWRVQTYWNTFAACADKYYGVHRSTTVALNWRMHTDKRPSFGYPENPVGPDLKGDLLYCKADRTIWWVFWESFIQSTLNVLSWLVAYGWLLTWLSFVVPCTWFCTRTFILQEVLGKARYMEILPFMNTLVSAP
jgi:hypothetical protein